ncbi:hypothetical protein [Streptomyces sp. H27-H5]|uniref:hypothetical protein n=1 Tax=Streptomyces sp. H27-H5 TaxID=2996460 RepID=UPI0022713508|nr:hypothetical protein [Streptomyces sp. H27-H5]MCY0956944.1 hypothetical protein [Streptomyces sp. H27-H5]
MSDHVGDRLAIEALTELRSALTAHGITLPSLDLHLPSYAATHRTPTLLALGSCNPATARALAATLNRAPRR